MTPAPFSQMVFLSPAQQNLMTQGAAIYTYHKIGQPSGRTTDPFLYTSTGEFDRQLSALTRAGFQVVSLDRVLAEGASRKTVALTFDDGFSNVFYHGLEILQRHKMSAIQFIVSGAIGKQNHWDILKRDVPEALMDVTQIKEWLAAGNEIGSHSVSHRNLKKLNLAQAREEITASKKSLEDTFGVPIRHFCYPYGGWTQPMRDLVAEAGYETASTAMEFGVNGSGADRFALQRMIPLSRRDLTLKILHRMLRKVHLR